MDRNDMDSFTALRCTKCGGEVKITPAQMTNLFVETDGTFVFIGSGEDESIECLFCKTKFIRKQKYEYHVGNISAGGIYIGGNSNANVIITGNGNTIFNKKEINHG